jgi:hypothetical protein
MVDQCTVLAMNKFGLEKGERRQELCFSYRYFWLAKIMRRLRLRFALFRRFGHREQSQVAKAGFGVDSE